jgi:very-short-patch-repair endonuclease
MIQTQNTFDTFGYYSESLSTSSSKRVVVKCDYCNCEYKVVNKNRNKSNKYVEKDACKGCRYEKRKDVSVARYGVENSAQRPEVREVLRGKNWINSPDFKEKAENTNLLRYGNKDPMKTGEIQQRLKSTMLDRYGVDNIMKHKDVASEASKKSIQTRIDRGLIKTFDGKTMPQLAKEKGWSRSHFGKLVKSIGIESALQREKMVSGLEATVMEWLDSEGIEYETQFTVDKKIADIRVGDILIECDGLYWHSDLFVDRKYHVKKRDVYISHGYRPLFIRGDEINNKFDIVKSVIKNALNLNNVRMYARKLEVGRVCKYVARDFMNRNHLMGAAPSVSFSLGLFDKDELVSVMQFKKTSGNKYDISRYCSLIGRAIVGGFTKLLSNFSKTCEPESVSTFIDLRYGTGDYLPRFGFKEMSCYESFSWTNGAKTFHRMKFPGNSGYEQGLYKIWDCGQKKYQLSYIPI